MTINADEIKQLFESKGQGHIFARFDALSDTEKQSLLDDCARVDFDWLEARTKEFKESDGAEPEKLSLKEAPIITAPKTDEEKAKEDEAKKLGEEALRQGRLGAFLVAGGQGTRLGFDGPKGSYPLGPVTDKPLFQWHAEQILALNKKYDTLIPWYIMTSRTNDAATQEFFKEHDFFGLKSEDVMFFQQGMVPSIDFDGKLILSDKCGLALNPDGHGGSLSALVKSGAIADMKKRGVDMISYFQVDNPLVTVCDPVFAGYHIQAKAEMSSKILEKACPEEKIGIICYSEGELAVVEYSDLDDENMYAKGDGGRMKFWAGSIAIHMISVDFVENVGGNATLPWHIARKKIPYFSGTETVKPEDANGIKFETFVFDALPQTTASATMEVIREEEFAPVKNPTGVDSVESSRQLLSNRFARWLKACGKSVNMDAQGNVGINIEISPLYALDAEELKSKIPADLEIKDGLVLE